jgi:hypothetical protein
MLEGQLDAVQRQPDISEDASVRADPGSRQRQVYYVEMFSVIS